MVRTQIQLSEEQAKRLKEIAHRENISIAEITRRAIDRWLQTEGSTSQADRRRRALSVIGQFHSGHDDTSDRHDDYLVESFDQ